MTTKNATKKPAAKKPVSVELHSNDGVKTEETYIPQVQQMFNELDAQADEASEVAKLKAELEAAKAELMGLKSKPVSTKELSPKAARRRDWQAAIPAEELDDETTILGKAQRLDRELLLVSTFKAVRALKWSQLAEVFVYLVTKCAEGGGVTGEDTVESLFAELTTKREPKAKAETEVK